MDALRIHQKPKKGKITIELPNNLAQQEELEIIILPIKKEEAVSEMQFNPSDYFGIWRDKNIDVNKVSKEMREEWDRSF